MQIFFAGLLAALLGLSGCSVTPPKPPVCDGSARRPVNLNQQPLALGLPAVDTCSRG